MLDQLRDGDAVVVWKLDRLSRALKNVLHIMEEIAEAGAGFRSMTENIDTIAPAGRMMMQMVGSFAEFERAMIREHTSTRLRRTGRRARKRPTQEARCCQAARDRGKRHHWSQIRRRDGAIVWC